MQAHQHLPDSNRLSVVTALVLLAYALTPSIALPIPALSLSLGGAIFTFQLTSSSLTSLFVALLAGSGAAWLLQAHPHPLNRWQLLQHVPLPALTAWVIGVPLSNMSGGPQWWAVFTFGGILFVLVLTAEYIAVEPSDVRHGPSAIGLSAVIFSLYLILVIALHAANTRLYLFLPAITLVMSLAAQRVLTLRIGRAVHWAWATGIALVIGQFAIGLHYLPLPPIRYGLFITALAYALTSFAANWIEERLPPGLWLEPGIMATVLLLIAILL